MFILADIKRFIQLKIKFLLFSQAIHSFTRTKNCIGGHLGSLDALEKTENINTMRYHYKAHTGDKRDIVSALHMYIAFYLVLGEILGLSVHSWSPFFQLSHSQGIDLCQSLC